MTGYRVVWEIDIEADTPEDAAREACAIQRDPKSTATFFNVTPHCPDCDGIHPDDTVLVDLQERKHVH